jgi:hypothetical protein
MVQGSGFFVVVLGVESQTVALVAIREMLSVWRVFKKSCDSRLWFVRALVQRKGNGLIHDRLNDHNKNS